VCVRVGKARYVAQRCEENVNRAGASVKRRRGRSGRRMSKKGNVIKKPMKDPTHVRSS